MECAVHIQNADDVAQVHRLAEWECSAKLGPVSGALLRALGDVPVQRVYYGAEFCENLIAGPDPMMAAWHAARAAGLGFTLLTPYVGGHGLARLRRLFQTLASLGEAEVVFNDWGVLRVLGKEFPRLKPVQGRLLHKSLRDPRVMGEYARSIAATGVTPTILALQQSNLPNAAYAAIYARYGVDTIEFDALPQGTDWACAGRQAAVYFPYGLISTARVCMAAALGYGKTDKFQPAAPCRHECQTHLLEYAYSNSPFENRQQRFWLKGNTYFFTHTEETLAEIRAAVEAGALSRIVIQPRVPMLASEAAAPRVRQRQPLVPLQVV